MSEVPVSMTDIVINLSRFSREITHAHWELADAEDKAIRAREAYRLAYAKAYIATEGLDERGRPWTIADREAKATIATTTERLAAEVAEGNLRRKREAISVIKTNIECVRSSGTLLRAEIEIDKIR